MPPDSSNLDSSLSNAGGRDPVLNIVLSMANPQSVAFSRFVSGKFRRLDPTSPCLTTSHRSLNSL